MDTLNNLINSRKWRILTALTINLLTLVTYGYYKDFNISPIQGVGILLPIAIWLSLVISFVKGGAMYTPYILRNTEENYIYRIISLFIAAIIISVTFFSSTVR